MSNFSQVFLPFESLVFPDHDFPVGCVSPILKELQGRRGIAWDAKAINPLTCSRSQGGTWEEFYHFKAKWARTMRESYGGTLIYTVFVFHSLPHNYDLPLFCNFFV